MKRLKHTWQLYRLDWQRIFKNPLATLLIIALMIIPSLYAWFNIKALWDPYSNTGELPIAVYSDDKAATFQDKTVNIGDEVLTALHDNDQLGWVFVDSKKELDQGVKSGKYYAGIYLPASFSKDLLSFTTGEIKKPTIEYTLNQKINAIAPKITDKGASSIQSMISSQFVETASDTLLQVFNEVGYDIDANLVSLNKLKTLILDTDENIETINGYLKEVSALNQKMPEIEGKLALANEFVDYLPEVDALGQKLIALNQKMPELTRQAQVIVTLQQKIPEIQNAGQQLAAIDNDFASVEQTMNEGIAEAKQGLQIIQQVETALPTIEKLGDQAADFADVTKDGAEQLRSALPSITNSVEITLAAVGEVGTSISTLAQAIDQQLAAGELTPEERAAMKQLLSDFADNLTKQRANIQQTVEFMTELQRAAGNTALAEPIERLNRIDQQLAALQQRVATTSEQIDQLSLAELEDFVAKVGEVGSAVAADVNGVDTSKISGLINEDLSLLISTIDTADGLLEKAQQLDLQSLLSATEKTVSNAVATLETYQKQLPAIKQEIHDANELLNGNMTNIVNAINKGADLYQNELPALTTKLNTAADFMANDWPGIKTDITTTLTTVNEKLPTLKQALSTAEDLIENDWPSIQNGLHKAAQAIREGESQYDLSEIIKLLKLDATAESDFFASPVALKENVLYPIANNGSASTPFYTALCLWVGALLFSSIATTDYYLNKKGRLVFSQREQFAARGLTFLTMGVAQALIVSLGNIFLLGVDVAQPVYSVLFAVLTALTFSMIIYVLVALFGNVGKGIGIIILVLSISGGGGNYPIQVSSKFFQMINPLLPFTHAVNLLREAAGGIYWQNAVGYLLILCGIFGVFGILGLWLYPKVSAPMKRLAAKSHASHIFH